MNLLQFKELAYQNSKNKGFWENGENQDRSEMVMLIISELAEAVDAHRSGKYAQVEQFLNYTEAGEDLDTCYIKWIKGSIEEEMADVAIRFLVYFEGWNITIDPAAAHVRVFTNNFAGDVWHLTYNICKARNKEIEKDSVNIINMKWGEVFSEFCDLCRHYRVEIQSHVKWKMMYNASRPYKHGKAY